MRPSLLDSARRATPARRRNEVTARRGTLLAFDTPTNRAVVTVLGSDPFPLPALPGAYVVGGAVYITVDPVTGKPVRVDGPAHA